MKATISKRRMRQTNINMTSRPILTWSIITISVLLL